MPPPCRITLRVPGDAMQAVKKRQQQQQKNLVLLSRHDITKL